MITTRRGFITGALALLAAPAVVRAESLMKIAVLRKTIIIDDYEEGHWIPELSFGGHPSLRKFSTIPPHHQDLASKTGPICATQQPFSSSSSQKHPAWVLTFQPLATINPPPQPEHPQ